MIRKLALVAGMAMATLALTSTPAQALTAVATIHVPGEVPAFFVGPISDNDPSTPDLPQIGANGIRDLTVTVVADATVAPIVTGIGSAPGCAANAHINTTIKVSAILDATVKIKVAYTETHADGTTEPHEGNLMVAVGTNRYALIPICVL